MALLLAVNGYILLHRNEGYKYFPYKSITELYVTDSSLYLKDLHFEGDSVNLIFSKSMQEHNELETWEVHADSIPVGFAKANLNSLRIALKNGIHHYSIQSIASKQSILCTIDHSSYNNQYINEFLYCNLPGPQIKVGALNTWHTDKGFSTQEIQQANQLLKDKTAFNKDSSDFYNTLAISKFVTTLCNKPEGLHAYKVSEFRPFDQIQLALNCKANLACGNYAAIIGYLFSVAKIPNRLVTFTGPAGNWQYGIHYYNEIYLREKQKWVLIDAANNIIMPHDAVTKEYLNAVSVNQLIKSNATANKLSYTFQSDTLKTIAYDSINNLHIYYNQSNANLCFLKSDANVTNSTLRTFFEFYTFSRDVDYFSDVNQNNWFKIFIKEVFAMLLIFTFILYFLFEIKYRKSLS